MTCGVRSEKKCSCVRTVGVICTQSVHSRAPHEKLMLQEPLKKDIDETQWHRSTLEPANRSKGDPFLPFHAAVGGLGTLENTGRNTRGSS